MPPLDGSEIVLCSPASALAEVGGLDGFLGLDDYPIGAAVDRMLLSAVWRPRTEDLERDPSWLQWIAYAVLQHDGRVFAYRRAKAGQEGRLHGRASLGIGGHVNPEDGHRVSPGTWHNLLDRALCREVIEEIRPVGSWSSRLVGLLHDPSTDVGRVHLGAVYLVELPSTDITPAPEVEPINWFAPRHLVLSTVAYRWESWSQILLTELPGLLAEVRVDQSVK